jgi:adenine-specific DNA-methyltransferase
MNMKINALSKSLDFDWSSEEENPLNPSLQDLDGLLFCGENKEILDGLALHQPSSIDFCYIDPPYNTRNKFIYEDTRSSVDHLIWGSHAEWMDFMKARLIPLKALLKETGLVAISIDDYEQPYLRVLMDQVFGEKNFIACISTCRSKTNMWLFMLNLKKRRLKDLRKNSTTHTINKMIMASTK